VGLDPLGSFALFHVRLRRTFLNAQTFLAIQPDSSSPLRWR
jgi:hypothetical protein